MVLILEMLYFVAWYELVWFFGALLIASFLHIGWRQQLTER